MDFTVTITEPAWLAGITWARELHNSAVLPTEEGEPGEGHCATDAEYVQWVMVQAAASYAYDQSYAAARDAHEASR